MAQCGPPPGIGPAANRRPPTAKKTTTKKTSSPRKAPRANTAARAAKPAPGAAKAPKAKAPAARANDGAPKRLSAIDAAAQVLADAGEPLRAKDMIERMAAKGLWSSPAGKTPAASLYAAIIREIASKGRQARFVRKDRGLFAPAKGA